VPAPLASFLRYTTAQKKKELELEYTKYSQYEVKVIGYDIF